MPPPQYAVDSNQREVRSGARKHCLPVPATAEVTAVWVKVGNPPQTDYVYVDPISLLQMDQAVHTIRTEDGGKLVKSRVFGRGYSKFVRETVIRGYELWPPEGYTARKLIELGLVQGVVANDVPAPVVESPAPAAPAAAPAPPPAAAAPVPPAAPAAEPVPPAAPAPVAAVPPPAPAVAAPPQAPVPAPPPAPVAAPPAPAPVAPGGPPPFPAPAPAAPVAPVAAPAPAAPAPVAPAPAPVAEEPVAAPPLPGLPQF